MLSNPVVSHTAVTTPAEQHCHRSDRQDIGERLEDDHIAINFRDESIPASHVLATEVDRQDEDDGGDQEGADQQRVEKPQMAEVAQVAGEYAAGLSLR